MIGDAPVRGYVPGGWDLFHVGHLTILRRAREHCDRLIVGVASDDALLAAKGRAPVEPLAVRMAVVAELDLVDQVVIDEGDKVAVWRQVGFDVVFKGDDWRGTAKGDRLERAMAGVGVRVHYFPYSRQTSTTALRAQLQGRA